MIKLIVNSDDFGYSRSINFGVIDAHKYGILNSATLMTNMPGAEHAFELAKENPELQVGIHLVLTCGKPLTNVPDLVDAEGYFKKNSIVFNDPNLNVEQVEQEWTAQIEKFLASGVPLTHIDSHHHAHGIPLLLPVVQRLSKKYNLPVRCSGDVQIEGVPAFSDVLAIDFYGETATFDYFEKLAERYPDGTIVEVMAHPGYLDTSVLNGSSYNVDRVKELEILTTVKLPENIQLL